MNAYILGGVGSPPLCSLDLITVVLEYLFTEKAAHRVIATIDHRNEPVRRLLERVGFRLEGTFVDADWFKDEWTTVDHWAILRPGVQTGQINSLTCSRATRDPRLAKLTATTCMLYRTSTRAHRHGTCLARRGRSWAASCCTPSVVLLIAHD